MVTKSAVKKAPRRSAMGKARESAKTAAKSAAATAAKLGRDVAETIGSGAMRTAGEVSELVGEATQNTLAYNPLLGIRRGDIAAGAKSLLKAVAVSPRKATQHFGAYLSELGSVVKGSSGAAPDPKDRRFADPAWKGNCPLPPPDAGELRRHAEGAVGLHRVHRPGPARQGARAVLRVAGDRCAGAEQLAAGQPGGGAQDRGHRRREPGGRAEEPGARHPVTTTCCRRRWTPRPSRWGRTWPRRRARWCTAPRCSS